MDRLFNDPRVRADIEQADDEDDGPQAARGAVGPEEK